MFPVSCLDFVQVCCRRSSEEKESLLPWLRFYLVKKKKPKSRCWKSKIKCRNSKIRGTNVQVLSQSKFFSSLLCCCFVFVELSPIQKENLIKQNKLGIMRSLCLYHMKKSAAKKLLHLKNESKEKPVRRRSCLIRRGFVLQSGWKRHFGMDEMSHLLWQKLLHRFLFPVGYFCPEHTIQLTEHHVKEENTGLYSPLLKLKHTRSASMVLCVPVCVCVWMS